MKNIVELIKEKEIFKTANTETFEGAKAWLISDKERLMQYAMTGVLGRAFYVSQKDIVEEAINLIEKSDANDLAEAIVLGRNVGYIRSFPILGLVYLSKKDINLFKKSFEHIIKTGNDLEDFINMCHSVRGFGRGIKTAIINWLNKNANPYYALKYRKQLADAIRISRTKSNDLIYAFILKDVVNIESEKYISCLNKYEELKAFTEIPKLLSEEKYDEVADKIIKYKLDVDSLTAYYSKFNKTIWMAIAQNSPVMRFIKYLDKFQRVGIDVTAIAKEKITVNNLKRAKVFPFRLYIAYQEICSKNMDVANILAKVLDDYVNQYDWGKFNTKSWAICPDVSGSMSAICSGNLSYLKIASMISAFFAKGLDSVNVYPWASSLKTYAIPYRDSVISQMKYLENMGGGGTNMSCALEYMLKNNIQKDVCVFVTDTESYSRKSTWGGDGTSWIEAWIKYHKKYPNSKAIIIRGDTYDNQPMNEEQCEKYNIYQIFGWNDRVIDYIQSVI